MNLLGRAVVAIWNDILQDQRTTFIEWHNREHIAERVAIPGFLRGRRYFAADAMPQYFTLYDAEDAAVLTGQDYLARLNNPTPWTRQATQAFRNTARGICRVAYSAGCGDGGFLLTLRFDAQPGQADALEHYLAQTALPPLVRIAGVSGVHLAIADQAASNIDTAERRGRQVAMPSWIVMVEGSWASAVDMACDALLAADVQAQGVTGPVARGLYGLEICCIKTGIVTVTGASGGGGDE
jgi:hypothetical protein